MTTGVLTFTVQGSGPNLVVLHSLLADHTSFEQVAGQLAEHFCVWVVSLPGFGKSAPPSRPDITAYADRIAAFLHSGPGLDSAVLGNGLGAFIALAVASRHPLRGDLIVANTLPTFSEEGRAKLRALGESVRRGGMAAGIEPAIARLFPPAFVAAHPDVVDGRRRSLAELDPAVFSGACDALSNLDLSADLAKIRCRTLVIAGELDTTTPPALTQLVSEAVPGADYVLLPNCGHCPQLHAPGRFVEVLLTFLAEGARPPARLEPVP